MKKKEGEQKARMRAWDRGDINSVDQWNSVVVAGGEVW